MAQAKQPLLISDAIKFVSKILIMLYLKRPLLVSDARNVSHPQHGLERRLRPRHVVQHLRAGTFKSRDSCTLGI